MLIDPTRIATRHIEAMAKILKGAPAPLDWGFYSEEEPRMHLQTMNPNKHGDYKYFLERDGQRVLEPALALPNNKMLKSFAAEVRAKSDLIEIEWLSRVIAKGHLKLDFDGRVVTLMLYPQLGTRGVKRTVDVPERFPGLPLEKVRPSLDAEEATLILSQREDGSRRIDLFLPNLLWEGTR